MTYEKQVGREWAKIDLEIEYWEYQANIDEPETYDEGFLVIEDGHCIDFDGCGILPELVIDLLQQHNIDCTEL